MVKTTSVKPFQAKSLSNSPNKMQKGMRKSNSEQRVQLKEPQQRTGSSKTRNMVLPSIYQEMSKKLVH